MNFIDKQVFLLPHAKVIFCVLLCFGVADACFIFGQACGLSAALCTLWRNAGLVSAEELLSPSLLSAIGLFGLCYVARQMCEYARTALSARFARERTKELRQELIENIYEGGPTLSAHFGTGLLTTTAIEGLAKIKNYLGIVMPKTADLFAVPATLAIFLFGLDWISGLITILMLPCIMFYLRMLGLSAREAAEKQHNTYVRLANHFTDTLRGLSTLKLFGRSKNYGEKVYRYSEKLRETSLESIKIATLSSLAIDLFRTFALAAVAILLGFRLMSGFAELFNALAVLIIIPEFFAVIRRFSTDFHASLDGKNQLEQVRNILEYRANMAADNNNTDERRDNERLHTAYIDASPDGCSSSTSHAAALSHPENTPCTLELQKVSYKALQNISVTFHGAMKIGIVGESGAGKTTLTQILGGFAQPTSGEIRKDGKPLDIRAWQQNLLYIPQNPYIFHATLRENIAFYVPDATPEAIARAVEAAGLSELVQALPDGLDTQIGDGGRRLSGGQTQRIALARAFVAQNRRVVIFDEPTAHLDIETELALKDNMLACMEGRLVFFATHRLHWMNNMDYILVMDKGCLVQQGTLPELLASPGPFTNVVKRLRGETDEQ